MTSFEATSPATVGFIDIGTNSIRLLVVRITADHYSTVVHRLKETVRLGEDEFSNHRLRPRAVERATAIISQFAMLARASGAEEVVAVATSATREAENQRYFVDRIRDEANVEVHVISGLEEARLVYLGVVSGLHLADRRAFCIDIGGGSTEVIVGGQERYEYLNSLKLGAIRLSTRFLKDEDGPVSPRRYELIKRYVRSESAAAIAELHEHPFDMAVGGSGTIENLADIASMMVNARPRQRDDTLTYSDLRKVIGLLCSLPLDARRKVAGINPSRADIIVGGAAILDTIMEDLSIRELRISDRGLREGMVVDYLDRHGHDRSTGVSIRERSVLQLGRSCHFNEAHARATAAIALRLFDDGLAMGLHRLGGWERELLYNTSLLHHIGAFLTYSDYQKHTEYMIRHADLLGFDETEVSLMALAARHHRNGLPRKGSAALAELPESLQQTVLVLSAFLRLAEGLDQSQADIVEEARLQELDAGRVLLRVRARRGWGSELWALNNQSRAFERVFNRKLAIEALPVELAIS